MTFEQEWIDNFPISSTVPDEEVPEIYTYILCKNKNKEMKLGTYEKHLRKLALQEYL